MDDRDGEEPFRSFFVGLGLLGEGQHTATACEQAAETMRKAEAMPVQTVGKGQAGPGRGKRFDNIKPFKSGQGGSSKDYLASRIKRDRPDIAERVENGEFDSMRQAAIAAGIIKPKSLVERALALCKRMSALLFALSHDNIVVMR